MATALTYRQYYGVFVLILLGLTGFVVPVQNHSSSDYLYAKRVAAIKLMPSWDAPVTLAIATVYNGEVVALEHTRPERFIRIFSGNERHKANPNSKDFFQLHHIPNCGSVYDSVFRESITACEAVDNLWKLRYAVHPRTGEKGGWAHTEGAPDASQLSMLNAFGIKKLNDFAIGEDAWSLLTAVSNTQWRQSYH